MNLLTIVIVLALLATVATLGSGIVSMVRGGQYDREHDTRFMFGRVGLQGLTFVLLLVALVLSGT